MYSLPGKLIFSERTYFRLIRHVLLFVSMNLLFTWVAYTRSNGDHRFIFYLEIVLRNSIFFFSYAYLTAYLLFPVFLYKKRFLLFLLSFVFLGILISSIKFLFSDYLFYSAIASNADDPMVRFNLAQILTNTKDMTFIVAVFLIAKFAKDNYHLRKKMLVMHEKHVAGEIKLMKNHMNPHVIFNNLNNLYSLAVNKPGNEGPYLKSLRELIAYIFVGSRSERVLLVEEIEAIRNYISLEKLRYGERLNFEFVILGDPEKRIITPLLLFPFVENCFEHGCTGDTGNPWVKLAIEFNGKDVVFKAANSKPEVGLSGKRKAGSSIDITKKKLDLYYGGKYKLQVDDDLGSFKVELKMVV